jgi:hypothetical protein
MSEENRIRLTPKMLAAGVAAYEEWDRFVQAPLEGKNRAWLTKQEEHRLSERTMIVEIVTAMFGSGAVISPDAE